MPRSLNSLEILSIYHEKGAPELTQNLANAITNCVWAFKNYQENIKSLAASVFPSIMSIMFRITESYICIRYLCCSIRGSSKFMEFNFPLSLINLREGSTRRETVRIVQLHATECFL